MPTVGELVTNVTAKTAPFESGMKRSRRELSLFQKSSKAASGALGSLTNVVRSGASTLLGLSGAISAGGLIGFGVKLAADAEQAEVGFTTMLKSAERAKELIAELNEFSAVTPFEPTEIRDAGRQLLGFGFAANEVRSTLENLGDIAAGTQSDIGGLVEALGQVRATGRAELGDINKFANRGVPIFQALADQMGVATTEVRKLASTGQIGFKELQAALMRTTTAGGLFQGSMVAQSKTIRGLVSTLQGELKFALEEIGKTIVDQVDLKGLINDLTQFTKVLKSETIPAMSDFVKTTTGGADQTRLLLQDIKDFAAFLGDSFLKAQTGATSGFRVLIGHINDANAAFTALQVTTKSFVDSLSGVKGTADALSGLVAGSRQVTGFADSFVRGLGFGGRGNKTFADELDKTIREQNLNRLGRGVGGVPNRNLGGGTGPEISIPGIGIIPELLKATKPQQGDLFSSLIGIGGRSGRGFAEGIAGILPQVADRFAFALKSVDLGGILAAGRQETPLQFLGAAEQGTAAAISAIARADAARKGNTTEQQQLKAMQDMLAVLRNAFGRGREFVVEQVAQF